MRYLENQSRRNCMLRASAVLLVPMFVVFSGCGSSDATDGTSASTSNSSGSSSASANGATANATGPTVIDIGTSGGAQSGDPGNNAPPPVTYGEAKSYTRATADRPAVYPVHGKLLHKGEPAEGAEVILHPLDEKLASELRPVGRVGSDGSFQLTSYRSNDGAPVGDYAMTVTWSRATADGREPADAAVESDYFQGRYSNPNRPLRTISIREADNALVTFNIP